jgi:hypothetical protein
MLLTNLIPGRHFFNLTVVSNEEIEDKILVEVQVLKGNNAYILKDEINYTVFFQG